MQGNISIPMLAYFKYKQHDFSFIENIVNHISSDQIVK